MFEFIFSTVPKWIMLFIILIIPFATYAMGVHTFIIDTGYSYNTVLQYSGQVEIDTLSAPVINVFNEGTFNMPRDYIICRLNNNNNYNYTTQVKYI